MIWSASPSEAHPIAVVGESDMELGPFIEPLTGMERLRCDLFTGSAREYGYHVTRYHDCALRMVLLVARKSGAECR